MARSGTFAGSRQDHQLALAAVWAVRRAKQRPRWTRRCKLRVDGLQCSERVCRRCFTHRSVQCESWCCKSEQTPVGTGKNTDPAAVLVFLALAHNRAVHPCIPQHNLQSSAPTATPRLHERRRHPPNCCWQGNTQKARAGMMAVILWARYVQGHRSPDRGSKGFGLKAIATCRRHSQRVVKGM